MTNLQVSALSRQAWPRGGPPSCRRALQPAHLAPQDGFTPDFVRRTFATATIRATCETTQSPQTTPPTGHPCSPTSKSRKPTR